ncbi:hypothetical protein SCHPADRAFT_941323 [Schizopora paradoxa]|uniref:Uncharacterized protein n=1 Tax=Schizopora paradoxa TaxID=27342 RepID=A0A0H2RL07_9AGAM|nr:hypothetical protein SCHPADRAFT_941323 [Schizopora paradoxa]
MFWNTNKPQASGPELQCQVNDITDTLTQINVLKRFQDKTEYRLIGDIAWNKADPYESSNLKRFQASAALPAEFQSQKLKSFLHHKHSGNMLRWEFLARKKGFRWEKEWASNEWQLVEIEKEEVVARAIEKSPSNFSMDYSPFIQQEFTQDDYVDIDVALICCLNLAGEIEFSVGCKREPVRALSRSSVLKDSKGGKDLHRAFLISEN